MSLVPDPSELVEAVDYVLHPNSYDEDIESLGDMGYVFFGEYLETGSKSDAVDELLGHAESLSGFMCRADVFCRLLWVGEMDPLEASEYVEKVVEEFDSIFKEV